jgi:polyisoprenoid-binding protein YceI
MLVCARRVLLDFLLTAAMLGLVIASSVQAHSAAASATWQIDPRHSAAEFSVRHLMISNVRGQFSKVTGTVNFDDKDVTKSSVDVNIDATTIDTREPDRDKHLRSADFFDVQNFPTMTFHSKRVTQAGPGKLKITGDLTIRGVTHEVSFEVEGPATPIKEPSGALRSAATATTQINRQDYGVKWNRNLDNGGVVVGDTVTITVDLEFVQKPATPNAKE